ncbi:hypothetical protein TNCT_514461 [Trichonephila clavata]|uniref:Uncharacterized protein n=1 Tax=Trichonephila clavata TaxID=2740835 RepID=A0A8X6F0P6_TRICU|nr:hypothetical protein TNCT_514461 [Trichonephila clavata]
MVLLVWMCFSIRFLFFSHWDILLLPPILILLDEFHKNIQDHEQLPGDWNSEAIGRHMQEDSKFKEQRENFASFDISTDHDPGRITKNRNKISSQFKLDYSKKN